jgi:hypothetical protein
MSRSRANFLVACFCWAFGVSILGLAACATAEHSMKVKIHGDAGVKDLLVCTQNPEEGKQDVLECVEFERFVLHLSEQNNLPSK